MRNWLATTWKKDPLVFCAWTIAFALLIGFGVSLWLFGHAKLFGGMSVSSTEVLRDIALTVAALLGFPLLLQRTRAAIKQADIDSRRLLADRYARSAELFASAELSARLAGLYALWDLAKEKVEIYHVRIMEILCAFVRNPPELKGWESGDDKYPAQRPDMEAILTLIRERNEAQYAQEQIARYRLNFSGADLCHAKLQGARLRGAEFYRADLSDAHLVEADLRGAQFSFADLRGAFLMEAKLNGTEEFENTALNGTHFEDVDDEGMRRIHDGVILTHSGKPSPPEEVYGNIQIGKLRQMELKDWQHEREVSRRDFKYY